MDLIEEFHEARKKLSHYFEAPVWHGVCINTEDSWTDYGQQHDSVGWYIQEDDDGCKEAMYSMEVYGTSRWESSDGKYTLFVGNDGCGNRDCYIFKNSLRVEDV